MITLISLLGSVFPSYLNFLVYFNFWLDVSGTGIFNIKYYQLVTSRSLSLNKMK